MKTCPECKDTFRGRTDKKFCSQDCRSAFHNRKNRDQTNLMRNINNSLRRNRRIILQLCNKKVHKVDHHQLAKKGFRFGYFTHIRKDEMERLLHFCYDVAYCEEKEHVLLIKEA